MLSLDTILLILAVPTLLSFTQYIAILVYRAVFCGNVQNLKNKYGSTWAFVSGLAPGLRCFPTQAAMAGARSLGDHGHVQFYSLV